MSILENLRAALERLLELEQLRSVAVTVLGDQVRSVARAWPTQALALRELMQLCEREHALEALCDVVVAEHPGGAEEVRAVRDDGFVPELSRLADAELTGLEVVRELGVGRHGSAHVVRRVPPASGQPAPGGLEELRLKLLAPHPGLSPSGVQRWVAATRLADRLDHPGLARGVVVGRFGAHWGVLHALGPARSLPGGAPPAPLVPLDTLLASGAPRRLVDVWPIVRGVLEPLAALHEHGVAHGNLSASNVLVGLEEPTGGGPGARPLAAAVSLFDMGFDRLGASVLWAAARRSDARRSCERWARYVAPETWRGAVGDPRSDLYAFGVLLYELMGGRAPLRRASVQALVLAQLTEPPDPLSFAAPRGWVIPELDELVLQLLDPESSGRPASAGDVLELLSAIVAVSVRPLVAMPTSALADQLAALAAAPADPGAAAALEAQVDQGASPLAVAEAFVAAAQALEGTDVASGARRRLLARAASLYEREAGDLDAAERCHRAVLALEPGQGSARAALERILFERGKLEELVEFLLERSERAESRVERAEALAKVGRLCAGRLGDDEQALAAYTAAFCEAPDDPSLEHEIGRLAGERREAWTELLETCQRFAAALPSGTQKSLLLSQVGRWYASRLQRGDQALACFEAVLAIDPANDTALTELAALYRRSHSWAEAARVLVTRAEVAATPGRARELLLDAAELFEERLGDLPAATELYERILEEEPGHRRAGNALERLHERAGDMARYAELLEQRAGAQPEPERWSTWCRAARVYEERATDLAAAERVYRAVLAEAPDDVAALEGVDRIYSRSGRYQELLDNLEQQSRVAVTPRRKVELLDRIAAIHAEQFLEPGTAAAVFERVLLLDPAHQGAQSFLLGYYTRLGHYEDVLRVERLALPAVSDPLEQARRLRRIAELLEQHLGSRPAALEAYERARELAPHDSEVLRAIARLRSESGDAANALEALEALANGAETQQQASGHWLEAGKLLEGRGDLPGAIDRYTRSVAAYASDAAVQALCEARVAAGQQALAVRLVEEQLAHRSSDEVRARLCMLLARAYGGAGGGAEQGGGEQGGAGKAEAAAARALGFDPTNREALTLLGDAAFRFGRFEEAARYYGELVEHGAHLGRHEAGRLLGNYLAALAHSGATTRALERAERFLVHAPDDLAVLGRLAEFHFEHGSATRAFELVVEVEERFGKELSRSDRASLLYLLGESCRRMGDLYSAIQPLEEAAELDTESPLPLRSLVKVRQAREEWVEAARAMVRLLGREQGEGRLALLMEMGELAEQRLGEPTTAAKAYLAALAQAPQDRKALLALLRLYSEQRDWGKLVDTLLKLAERIDDRRERAQALLTAARVAWHELEDLPRAEQLLRRVLDLGEPVEGALEDMTAVLAELGDWSGVEDLLEARIEAASRRGDRAAALALSDELVTVLDERLGSKERAIEVLRASLAVVPGEPLRTERLAELYRREPVVHLHEAVLAQLEVARRDPWRAEPYRALKQVYLAAKVPDGAWCACQVLSVLDRAEPDEAGYFESRRREDPLDLDRQLSASDWNELLIHPEVEPAMTAIFAQIQRLIVAARERQSVVGARLARAPGDSVPPPSPLEHAVQRGAVLLGVEPPPIVEDGEREGDGSLSVRAGGLSLVVGRDVADGRATARRAAHLAGTQLTFLRPGFHVRGLVGSGTGLKAWLMAAIKLVSPTVPIADDLAEAVELARSVLDAGLQGAARARLTHAVRELRRSQEVLDVNRWAAGVELTADRVGFLLCDDLAQSLQAVRSQPEGTHLSSASTRSRHLLLYAASEPYVRLRERLGIGAAGLVTHPAPL